MEGHLIWVSNMFNYIQKMEEIREIMHPSVSRPAADLTQETFYYISVASMTTGCIIL